jgi:hypothetical protein
MQWIKNKCYVHQYYKITEEGEQRSIYDPCKEAYTLHVYQDDVMKYYFIPPGGSYEMETPYTVNELSVCIRNRTYRLPPESFIFKRNVLFDRPLLRWLCIHYLGIMPADTCTIVAVTDSTYSGERLCVNTSLEKDIK